MGLLRRLVLGWLFPWRHRHRRQRATVTFSNVVAAHRVSVTFQRDKRGRA